MKKWKMTLALIAGWLIPGAAHWLYGHRHKALTFFALILTCAVAGIIIADFRFIRYADNPFYYIGQFGSGLTWLLNGWLTSASPKGLRPVSYFEIGLLYICVGGILNLVILLNLFAQQTHPAPQPEPQPEQAPVNETPKF